MSRDLASQPQRIASEVNASVGDTVGLRVDAATGGLLEALQQRIDSALGGQSQGMDAATARLQGEIEATTGSLAERLERIDAALAGDIPARFLSETAQLSSRIDEVRTVGSDQAARIESQVIRLESVVEALRSALDDLRNTAPSAAPADEPEARATEAIADVVETEPERTVEEEVVESEEAAAAAPPSEDEIAALEADAVAELASEDAVEAAAPEADAFAEVASEDAAQVGEAAVDGVVDESEDAAEAVAEEEAPVDEPTPIRPIETEAAEGNEALLGEGGRPVTLRIGELHSFQELMRVSAALSRLEGVASASVNSYRSLVATLSVFLVRPVTADRFAADLQEAMGGELRVTQATPGEVYISVA